MDIVVEPGARDAWVRRNAPPDRSACRLRETDEFDWPRRSRASSPPPPDGSQLDLILEAIVGQHSAPGWTWVARLSGARDNATVGGERASRRDPGAHGGSRPRRHDGGSDATETLVLDSARQVTTLLAACRGTHESVALLRITRPLAERVADALRHGDDAQAIAAAEMVVLYEPEARTVTVVGKPCAPAQPWTPWPLVDADHVPGPGLEVAGREIPWPAEPVAIGIAAKAPGQVAETAARTLPPAAGELPWHPVFGPGVAAASTAARGVRGAARIRRRPTGPLLPASVGAAVVVVVGVALVGLHARSNGPATAPASLTTAPPPTVAATHPAATAPPATRTSLPGGGGSAIAGRVPPGRADATVASDQAHGTVLLFGGADPGGAVLADTWTFDGSTWTPHDVRSAPPARRSALAAWDPAIKAVVLYGGVSPTGTPLDDTWLWDGSTWTALVPGRSRPPGGIPAGLTFDGARQALVLVTGIGTSAAPVTGQTWSLDGTTWAPIATRYAPLLDGPTALIYDPSTRLDVLVDVVSGMTWLHDGRTWVSLGRAGLAPDPDIRPSLALDAASGHLLLVQASPTGPAATWTFDGTGWVRVAPTPGPTSVGALATSPTGNGVIALAGTTAAGNLTEAWRWQGTWGPA